MGSRECLLKYGEKALQFYRKSIQKSVSPTHSDVIQQEHLKPIEHNGKHEVSKRLTIDEKKRSLIKQQGQQKKKSFNRSKSKVQLGDLEALTGGGTSGVPTTRKASKQSKLRKSNSQLYVKQSQMAHTKGLMRPCSQLATNREDIESRIKASLEIRDMDSFVRDVLKNINMLITSESSIGKWLGYFKLCFERLYAVSEQYIRRYALASQEVTRLKDELDDVKQRKLGTDIQQGQVRLNESNNSELIAGLTRKLQRFEQREKILLSTLEFLKNDGDPKDTSLSESLKREEKKAHPRAERLQSPSQDTKQYKPRPLQSSPVYI